MHGQYEYLYGRLNPCFNGRYSLSLEYYNQVIEDGRLNPCFNGRYSLSGYYDSDVDYYEVLILVLMEDTL